MCGSDDLRHRRDHSRRDSLLRDLLAISVFASLEKVLKAAFIAGLAAFGVALTTNYVQKKREMDFKIRERKIEAYQKVFDFLLFFLRSTKNDGLSDTEAVVSRIHEVNYSLLVWGSDLTIKAWQEFFRSLANLRFSKAGPSRFDAPHIHSTKQARRTDFDDTKRSRACR
jgi:hypothetical protein